MKITSTKVEPGVAHDRVIVWVDGKNVGVLIVGKGEGEQLAALLVPLRKVEHPARGTPVRD